VAVRLCAVSVDLDELSCYAQIHGLTASSESNAVYDLALGRIQAFARDLRLPLSLFVVGRDLERPQNAAKLQELVASGHEIGNHSLDHLYDLTRREESEQVRQVVLASERIHERLGVRPSGFRAPGYTVTDRLLRIVRECEMTYDSSVFPCPAYYLAKATRLLRMKIKGRASRAILSSARVLGAPNTPYRIGEQYWKPGTGLLELPIQVAGPLRLPFIGTALTLLGPSAARLLTRSLVGQRLVNLELHGLDFLEATEVSRELAEVQPDLRVPLSRKLDTLCTVIELLQKHRYSAVRLDEAARVLS
jgi:hypothetical protein